MKHQRFGGNAYSFSRMTWIKPNFLWMMYRAGWASKVNQERILAIRMSKFGFFQLLEQGVYSSFKSNKYSNYEAWKNALANSDVRIQWDPDHGPNGEKLERRAIQIGIKNEALKRFNEQYLVEIQDITDFVKTQKELLDQNSPEFSVMAEQIIELPIELNEKYSIGKKN